MDYVDALSKVIPVVKSLQEGGYDILSVTTCRLVKGECEIHVFEPKVNDFLRGRNATVRRLSTKNEWSVDVDGVRVFWLQSIEGASEVQTVTL